MKKETDKCDYNHDHIPELKEKALRISIREGSSAAVASSIGENYVTPFALAMGAQPIHIGLLSSISGLFYQLSQPFGSTLMEKQPRRKLVTNFIFIQSLLWLAISALGFVFIKGWFNSSQIYLLIAFYSLLMLIGGIVYPAWFSWMGDIVPEKSRGEYFSRRGRITSTVALIVVLATSFFLDLFKTKGYLLIGFSLLFALAFAFRFASYLMLKKQYCPQFKQKKTDYFSFWAFLKKYDNFGKFAVYQCFFNFAIMVASPFFAVYMLKDLNFSYSIFTMVNISLTGFMILSLPLIGRLSDKHGNKMLLALANILFIITPLLWLVSSNPIWIIFVPQLIAGVANAATYISYINFTYDAVSPRHRALCISYANILIGNGVFFGALVGGFLINYLHPANINPFIFVFLVAAGLRLLVAAYFLPRIKEVRKVTKIPSIYAMVHYPLHRVHAEVERFSHVPKQLLGKFKSLKVV